jgi:hypothetical protein
MKHTSIPQQNDISNIKLNEYLVAWAMKLLT